MSLVPNEGQKSMFPMIDELRKEVERLQKENDQLQEQLKNCNLQNVSFSLPNEGEIQKLYKDEMKKWKGTSWHTELEYHGELFIDGAKAVVTFLKGNES